MCKHSYFLGTTRIILTAEMHLFHFTHPDILFSVVPRLPGDNCGGRRDYTREALVAWNQCPRDISDKMFRSRSFRPLAVSLDANLALMIRRRKKKRSMGLWIKCKRMKTWRIGNYIYRKDLDWLEPQRIHISEPTIMVALASSAERILAVH